MKQKGDKEDKVASLGHDIMMAWRWSPREEESWEILLEIN
jgi:hypothetical protein